ncbi:MAG: HAD hydrolase-like protein, partial [Nitrospirota bacterium]
MPISSSALIDLSHIDAAIFDLDGVLTNTAKVHAAAWKSLFDQYLQKRAIQQGETFQAFDIVEDYRKYVDGKLRYDGVQSFLESRGITLLHGEPSDPPSQETVCGLGNRKNAMFLGALHAHGVDVFPSTLALIQELKDQKKKTA